MCEIINTIVETFKSRGGEKYGREDVTQLQHALQSATLAVEERAEDTLVAAALLHDIGHILHADHLPADTNENLDDKHEYRADAWLRDHFGPAVADPVRLHVAAKRYLCTREPDYEQALSPTSHKSYLDQGGRMNEQELQAFEAEPHFEEALRLRRWDDLAKDADKQTAEIETFVPQLTASLRN